MPGSPRVRGSDTTLPVSAPLGPGSTFGIYRIESQLGRGGMSIVYLAEDPRLARRVAIKVVEQRYDAVKEVLDGEGTVTEVAERYEAGVMTAMSGGVDIETKVQGGIMSGLKRSVLGGESFFINTFRAPQGGELAVSPTLPGDIVHLRWMGRPR